MKRLIPAGRYLDICNVDNGEESLEVQAFGRLFHVHKDKRAQEDVHWARMGQLIAEYLRERYEAAMREEE